MAKISNMQLGTNNALVLDSGAGLCATVVPQQGAVCSSLTIRKQDANIELLHKANEFPDMPMGGRIPVLFPVVGRSFVNGEINRYRHRDQIYPMEIHGFAKDTAWKVVECEEDRERAFVVCEMNSSEETLRSFPYEFCLQIEYAVRETLLTIQTRITNRSHSPMPFSLGFHPYFNAPIQPGLSPRNQCRIRIPALRLYEMKDTIPTGQYLPMGGEFALPNGVQVPDSGLEMIAFDLLPDPDGWTRCHFTDPAAGIEICQEFKPDEFETMTVYAPAGQPYVCLEPRTGVPMSLSDDSLVPNKGKILESGQTMEMSLAVNIRAV